ncbi:putative transcription factor interactor and regulator CCHC(Zn) family [Helianthus annuus]|nr:putative transcription factor interactor and regulator CCHC(Zn) family [Helianthus annuus]
MCFLSLGQQAQHQNNQPACTFKAFMDCKPQTFTGTEGAVGLLRWFEKAESVFAMCNYPAGDRVKYATGTLVDGALTWWNAQVQLLGIEAANATTWDDFKELIREEYCPRDEIQKLENEYYDLKMVGSEVEAYVKRSYELADMCPNLSRPMPRRIEFFIKGLPPRVKGLVTAANLNDLTQIVRLTHRIVDQEVESNSLPPRVSATTAATSTATVPASDNKRKWNDVDKATSASQSQKRPDNSINRSISQSSSVNQGQGGSQNQGSYVGKKPQCNRCGYHHYGQCVRACRRCEKVGHEAKDCRAPQPKHQQQQNQEYQRQQRQPPQQNQGFRKGCYQCGDEGHFKRDCPQLNQNANDNNHQNNNNAGNNNNGNNGGSGARGRVFTIGAGDARNDDNVVTGTFSVNNLIASVLFDSGADWSYVSLEFSQRLGLTPTPLEVKQIVELADSKTIEASHVLFGCKLDLVGQVFDIDLLPVTLGSFDIVVGMDWLSKHQAEILCKEKIVRIPIPDGEPLLVQGHRSGAMVGVISVMQAQKCLRKGYPSILALVTDTPSGERKIEDLPVVREFADVFPEQGRSRATSASYHGAPEEGAALREIF